MKKITVIIAGTAIALVFAIAGCEKSQAPAPTEKSAPTATMESAPTATAPAAPEHK